jgi:hypothetical protein
MFKKIKRGFKHWRFLNKFSNVKWRWPWYDFKNGVSNLVGYFKVVWNDRDWDYSGWLYLTDKKFERLEKGIREYGNHVRAEADADNIRKVRLALKRLIEDDYHSNAFKFHDKKWGNIGMDSTPCKWDDEGKPTLYQLDISRSLAVTEEEKNQENEETRRLIRHPDYLKKQDLEYVTTMINKYLFHWWD